jgi:hypothetical protein
MLLLSCTVAVAWTEARFWWQVSQVTFDQAENTFAMTKLDPLPRANPPLWVALL